MRTRSFGGSRYGFRPGARLSTGRRSSPSAPPVERIPLNPQAVASVIRGRPADSGMFGRNLDPKLRKGLERGVPFGKTGNSYKPQ